MDAVLVLASACGGDSGTGPTRHDQPPVDTTSQQDTTTIPADTGSAQDTVTVSAAVVNGAAAELYVTLLAGQDPTADVTAILRSFMPVLGAADSTALDSLLAIGAPVAPDFEAQVVAQAYRDSTMISLDNFITTAAAAGATVDDPAGPLTRAYLTAKLAPLVDQQTYTSADVVPGLVLALGRTRAQFSPAGITDPVWGDDQLDPLQTLLLLYAVNYSGTAAASSGLRPARTALVQAGTPSATRSTVLAQGVSTLTAPGKLGKFGATAFITSMVGKMIHFPLGYLGGADASICASVLLYSYKFQVSQSEDELWHHDPSHPQHPYQSHLNATLLFDFVPNAFGKHVLAAIGCQLPPVGPVAGKAVHWKIGDTLQVHGSLTGEDVTTNASGQANTTYETIPELVPGPLQVTTPHFTAGAFMLSASGLLPSAWSSLERAVDLVASPTDTVAGGIGIYYYRLPTALDLTDTITISTHAGQDGESDMEFAMHGSGHLVLTDSTRAIYQGSTSMAYDNFTLTVENPLGCQHMTVKGTTDGTMLGLVSPDDTGALQVSLLPIDPIPTENIDIECMGITRLNQFVLVWSSLRLTPAPAGSVDTVEATGLGTLRRIISRTGPVNDLGTVTEHTTINLTAVMP